MKPPAIPNTLVYLGGAIEVDGTQAEWKWKKSDGYVVATDEQGKRLFVFPKNGSAEKNPAERCPRGTRIQTYIFDREIFTKRSAKSWLKRNGAIQSEPDETANTIRHRQETPKHFRKSSFRTIPITEGVQAVVACPLKKWYANPKGEAVYKRFNRKPSKKTVGLTVNQPKKRAGKCHHVAYRSTKFGPCQSFVHVFDNQPTVWVDKLENPTVIVLTGGIKITRRGIEG